MPKMLELTLLEERFALVHLPPGASQPTWVRGAFTASLSSRRGTTVICASGCVPANLSVHAGFRCMEVAGISALDSVGVVAAIVSPLAAAEIGIFAYSTWDTDYILVQETDLQLAALVLTEAGHGLHGF